MAFSRFDLRYNCQLFMVFCHTMYAAGATDTIGFRYVSVIQSPKIVFFCPSPWAPEILSPKCRPIFRPMKNCRQHTINAVIVRHIISGSSSTGCLIMKLTACPMTMNKDIAHIQNDIDWCSAMVECMRGTENFNNIAVTNGISSNGMTSAHMVVNDSMKSMPSPRINDRHDGAATATTRLLSKEYVAIFVTLPPSIPVITGAAVAVGMKKQMNAPAAMFGFMK